ncbi:MAG: tRNA 2-thiouridine(34) synthase MnmA [Fimbriimonadales bacterium]|nr:tRNA 2-thiouridine(34) synthase MnmA [Fimbriimonadales bacterium]
MPRSSRSRGRVLVAMSGGVDSSVAAGLLVKRGYDVVGVTLQIWQESQTDPRHSGCCSLGAVEDARRVARALGIPHYVLNYRELFRETVIRDFLEEYARGRTPNPCVQCNRFLKFDPLLERLEEFGADAVATGHYVRSRRAPDGTMRLLQARCREKDQSYVLYMLQGDKLRRLRFPLGEVRAKQETRHLAEAWGLPVARKPDSQEICFVSEVGGYREFLRKANPDALQAGEIVTVAGEVLGRHQGIAGFTIGQRRGLGVAARDGKPLYVLGLLPAERRVVVGSADDLLRRVAVVRQATWWPPGPKEEPLRVMAKVRYNMEPQAAWLHTCSDGTIRLVFDDPVRAITPGQTAVAYRGRTVVVGGTIEHAEG